MPIRSTEALHPAAGGLQDRSPADALALLLDGQVAALAAVRPAIPALAQAAKLAADAISRGGKLGYAGAGSSGLMALADCLELAGTFGIAPEQTPMMFAGGAAALLHMQGAVEDDPALANADFAKAAMAAGDVILILTASGSTPYTLTIAELARDHGVTVIGLANVADATLFARCDLAITLDTGAEVIAGSTRMGAATAQKAALNLISAQMGIHLGHVYDGFMINVTADNAKLIDRAARIVAQLSGQGQEAAKTALAKTNGAVKHAILVARGMEPDAAHAAIHSNNGHLPRLTHHS